MTESEYAQLYDTFFQRLDRALAEREEIVFTVGTHRDAVLIPYVDYRNLVKPHLGTFSHIWQSAAA